MKAVRTADSNFVYLGPSPEIRDLHCRREPGGEVISVWWLTPVEREAIAAGANIRLVIWAEPIPPVALQVTDEQGVGEDAPDVLARLAEYVG